MTAALHALAANVMCALAMAAPFCMAIGALAYAYRRQLAAFDRAEASAADSIGRGQC